MYTAIELAKKLCEENKGKVFLGKNTDPANVVIYCNRPDLIKLDEKTGWSFSKGAFTCKQLAASGMYETISVLPKFYLEDNK